MSPHPHFADPAYLLDGFEHVETMPEFEARLKLGRPLNVKLGIDPTSPDLHLGFMVVLNQLQRFAEVGHNVTLIIGDFTAKIGDPSGKNETRPQLSDDEIEANMHTYTEQAAKVLDMDRITVRHNSEWLAPLTTADFIKLAAKVSVAQMLERNDFRQRYEGGESISLHEFLYPIAMAYDSVMVESDVELGGVDQLFNLLMGRHYQREHGQAAQICAMVPLLVGLDGHKKMSKSLGNYVGVTESPQTQFGKLMSIGDESMPIYARYAAFRSKEACASLVASLATGANPMDAKKQIAQDVVGRYHGVDAGVAAREYFERTVQRKEIPIEQIADLSRGDCTRVAELLVKVGFAESKRAAERLISGNGVKVDGIVVNDPKAPWTASGPAVLSVGSRKFVRITP
ncbi:MAG: tyrosine--tRNA ligase [Candidatus Eremiobacteraeota bacterium]|nr:tyrosine--tRNA ligase [Candidatus Eremiobacteraeota bacterium]